MIAEAKRVPTPAVLPGAVDRDNPWPGLAAFREADSEFFYGRGPATDELLRRVRRERLTVLHGLSGLGKSSLLRAGLFPRLREESILPILVRLDYSEGAPDLVAQVQEALEDATAEAGVEAPPRRAGESLWEYLHRPDNELWSLRNRLLTPVLVLDQFEEIFTLGRSRGGLAPVREAFLAELADLVEGRPPSRLQTRLEENPGVAAEYDFQRHPYKVLLALREDFLAELEELRGKMPSLAHNRMRLLRMSGEDALAVVAGAGGHLVEPDVADRIVRFVSGAQEREGAALRELTTEPALLSVVCRELNLRRQQRGEERITSGLLDGDRNEILADFYERGVADLAPEARRFLEERLLTASGYRDSVAIEDALAVPALSHEAIDLLVSRRLLRIEERGGVPRIELTHDVLTGVVQASRDARRDREAREEAEAARREAEERERLAAAKLRRSRITSAVLAASLVLALITGIWALVAQRKARQAQMQAQQAQVNSLYKSARSLAIEGSSGAAESLAHLASVLRLEPGHERARYLMDDLLLRRAWPLPRLVLPHDDALVGAAHSEDGRVIITLTRAGELHVWDGESGLRRGGPLRHGSEISSAAVSRDGRWVVTADLDGQARLWNAIDGESTGRLVRDPDGITSVEFTPDSRHVVTLSRGGVARLWDAGSGQPVGQSMPNGGPAGLFVMSPSTGVFAIGSALDAVVRLWDAATGEPIGQPLVHAGESLWALDLSRDGSRVLTITGAGIRLWDGRSGEWLETLQLPTWVTAGRFAPDGRSIAFGNPDGNAFLWDLASGTQTGRALPHSAEVIALEFSDDGRRLLTTSADDTVSLWDVGTGTMLGQPIRHGGAVSTARFSRPDGLAAVTASADTSARVWDLRLAQGDGYLASREPGGWWNVLDAEGRYSLAHFERDGAPYIRAHEVATGTPLGPPIPLPHRPSRSLLGSRGRCALIFSDGLGVLFDTRSGSVVGESLLHDDGAIVNARLGADGRLAVTWSDGGSARVWELASGRLVGTIPAEPSRILAADLDPLGQRLVTGHERLAAGQGDSTVKLWELPSLEEAPKQPPPRDLSVSMVRFLSDRHLLAATSDGELWLEDLVTGQRTSETMRHHSSVLDADLSTDGRRVVTASFDGTARVWSLPEGEAVGRAMRLGSAVVSTSFSPDGRSVLAADDNRTRLWLAETGESLGLGVQHGTIYGGAFDAPYGYRMVEARFLEDGPGWVTAGRDGTTIIWRSTLGLEDDPEALADLAEAVSGFEVDGEGVLQPILDPAARLAALRERAGREDLPFVRWFLSDPWERTITPFSELTVEQYIRHRLGALEATLEELPSESPEDLERSVRAELEIALPGHPLLRPAGIEP